MNFLTHDNEWNLLFSSLNASCSLHVKKIPWLFRPSLEVGEADKKLWIFINIPKPRIPSFISLPSFRRVMIMLVRKYVNPHRATKSAGKEWRNSNYVGVSSTSLRHIREQRAQCKSENGKWSKSQRWGGQRRANWEKVMLGLANSWAPNSR